MGTVQRWLPLLCGLLPLPHGVMWSGNYICSRTGLAMRVVGAYDFSADTYDLRWDVLCG